MPKDYSNYSPAEIMANLKLYGAEIGSFHMGMFRESAGGSGEGGYCNGVLLDWIRRVLLTKTKRDEVRDKAFLTFHFDALEEAKGKAETKRSEQEKEKLERASQTFERMQQAYTSSQMTWVEKGVNQPKAISSEEWKNAVSAMDDVRDKQRLEAKRTVKENRRFADLVLMENEKKTYADANQWMGTLFQSANQTILVAGYCTVLGFSVKSAPGHSVAIWQRRQAKDRNDSFYFFDPNYGVYSFNFRKGTGQKFGLKGALQMLFFRDNEDTPKYKNCTAAKDQEMSYMRFGPQKLVE
jgi:hypothetical protein